MNGSMVTGVLGNVLVLSPLVIVAQGRLTHRLLVALTDDIVNSQMGFQLYYAGLGKPSFFTEKPYKLQINLEKERVSLSSACIKLYMGSL
jgi:hypothetical protein